jgi:hypothetical protein
MAKFKNTVTGNILEVTDSLTIALMTASDRYEKLGTEDATEAPAPATKKTAKAKAEA